MDNLLYKDENKFKQIKEISEKNIRFKLTISQKLKQAFPPKPPNQ